MNRQRPAAHQGDGAKRRRWTSDEVALLRALYADTPTLEIAAKLDRRLGMVYQRAQLLGLRKSAEYLAGPHACRLRRGGAGHAHRFPKGNVPWNKGTHWDSGGRSHATRFKKGQWPANKDPAFYVLGALRWNADGYLEMRVSFEPGSIGWRGMHLILWEEAHGPLPKGFAVCFRDRDVTNVELANFELVSRADLMRRNTVQNLPAPLKSAIHALGQLRRRIREREKRETV